MEKISEKDLGYAGGIIDGEGSICINKHKSNECKRGYSFVLNVSVSNTNEWLLEWLKLNFGGYKYPRKKWKTHHSFSWCWMIESQKALEFLRIIKPYLKIKSFQAEIAISFQEAKRRGRYKEEKLWAVEEAQNILLKSLHIGLPL